MKRAFSLLLAACALLAVLLDSGCARYTHIVIASQQVGDFYCSVYEDETLEIIKYTGEDEIVAIPARMGEYEVVGISTRAFNACKTVKEVYLPATMTSLPAKLFDDCPQLTAIYIPASIKSIGKNLVYNCPAFTTVRYAGTQKQWGAVSKGNVLTENYSIANAEMVYEFVVGD